ncbi:hypothetical protein AALO_G00101180 [Alosa alosa]|uniref:Ig-like domain-containing protein n=1 Tax=Alosa alosa TaxID=278164 RepID=A0AAV6GXP4_9TELE|nr:hypothetical protein AALO_G00101180 [Alosa alosa]
MKVKEVDAGDENQIKVTCSTSCSLGSDLQYVWYKNGQTLQDKTTASMLVYEVASYSCAVKGYEALRSPAKYLNLADEYKNHVENLGNNKSSCTLRLKDIRVSHSGEYVFRVTTTEGESYSGLPGVNVSVTALQVLTPPEAVTEGERVTLTCDTTCALSKDPIFI